MHQMALPANVAAPKRTRPISATPAGMDMKVRTTGRMRPKNTAGSPRRRNHRSALSRSELREQDVAAELVHEGTATEAADRPAYERAEELSDDGDHDHSRDLEPAGRSQVPGVAESHLGRDRHACRFREGQQNERKIAPEERRCCTTRSF